MSDIAGLPPAAWLTLAGVGLGLTFIGEQYVEGKLFRSKKKALPGRQLNPPEIPTRDEIGKYCLILNNDRSYPVIIGEDARFLHVQILGATGVGKNYYAMLPWIYQDIQNGAGCVIIDPKGAMRGLVAAYAKKFHRLHQTHFLSLSKPGLSDTYSPFVDPDPHVVAERFYEAFYQDDKTPTPYYKEHAHGFLLNLFGLFKKMNVVPTMDQVRTIALDQDALAMLLRTAPACREAKEMHFQMVVGTKGDEYRKSFQGLVNKLTAVCGAPFAPVLNTTSPSINMRDVLTKGEILYVDLAADLYPTSFQRISTMLMMDLQNCLTDRYQKPHLKPTFLYMDEFADLIYPKVRALIAKARDARVGVVYAHQSLGDLEHHGEGIAKGIFESSRNKVVFQVGSAETAEYLSKLFGTKTVEREVVNYSFGEGIFAGATQKKGMTPIQEEQFLVHPNDLKNLPTGSAACLIQRGLKGRSPYLIALQHAPDSVLPLRDDEMLKPLQGIQLPVLEISGGASKVLPAPATQPLNQAAIDALKKLGEKRRANPLPDDGPPEEPKAPPSPPNKPLDPTTDKAPSKKPRKKRRAEES
ncbi:MAG TPA: type IV secretion system DNA-binding domain-containing protein [bacterium]|jgi:type IV secretory pathway TraG/TraD family ATPase VirD4|nr:type IV secretion system DNA-binding domain-containing protein [bacterium]